MNKGRERGFITGVNDRWDKRKHQGSRSKITIFVWFYAPKGWILWSQISCFYKLVLIFYWFYGNSCNAI